MNEDIVLKIKQTKEQNGRVIAVGTTSVRALETAFQDIPGKYNGCLLYTSPSPRDRSLSRMPSSA